MRKQSFCDSCPMVFQVVCLWFISGSTFCGSGGWFPSNVNGIVFRFWRIESPVCVWIDALRVLSGSVRCRICIPIKKSTLGEFARIERARKDEVRSALMKLNKYNKTKIEASAVDHLKLWTMSPFAKDGHTRSAKLNLFLPLPKCTPRFGGLTTNYLEAVSG